MKIVYAAGNLNDSNTRLSHFLRYTKHDVRIAAYYNNSNDIQCIDWLLDSMYYGKPNSQIINSYIEEKFNINPVPFEMMLNDILEWNPELFIVDFEPICASIAKAIDIPFISCSPLHLIDGVSWESRNKHLFLDTSKKLKVFDGAIEKLIYSPFGLLNNSPILNDGFDWIMPYSYESYRSYTDTIQKRISEYSKNKAFSTGTSGSLTKKILNQQEICVAQDPDDIECALNSVFVDSLGIGAAIGKAEENMSYASLKIDKFLNTKYKYSISKKYDLLHERIL